MRRLLFTAFVCTLPLAALTSPCSSAGLGDLLGGGVSIPGLDSLTKEKPPITTSLSDAVTEVPFLDDFNPQTFAPMTRLARGPNNGFLIERPGMYALEARSYCLHAGTHGPSKGSGYVYARLAGPRAAIIRKIAQNSVAHPEIDQHTVQTLIWSVLSRAKISDTSQDIRDAASALLSKKEIDDLNGGALGRIPQEVLDRVMGNLPEPAQRIMQAEADLRSAITGGSTFAELESIAVLTGECGLGEGSREVPEGRWSYHPDGYFVRYFPDGYSHTRIELCVPRPITLKRDEANRITSISDAIGSRIEVEYDDGTEPVVVPKDEAVKAFKISKIRFVSIRPVGPELVQTLTAEFANPGWTLLGATNGKGSADASSEGFADLKARYRQAVDVSSEIVTLSKNVAKLLGKEAKNRPFQLDADFADLAHMSIAVGALAEQVKARADWTGDHALLAKEGWLGSVCRSFGAGLQPQAYGRKLLASASLVGVLIGSPDGPCDGDPPRRENPDEFDPSGGSAMPGNTDQQRLLPSAAEQDPSQPNRDCGAVNDLMSELQTIRNAFQNTIPNPGEDGFDYANRVQGALGYSPGNTEGSGGAFAPMETNTQCVTTVNENYYSSKPPIFREADCAHENVHRDKCRWALDHATGGYASWMSDASNYRQNELDAYQAGIDKLNNWKQQNGCN